MRWYGCSIYNAIIILYLKCKRIYKDGKKSNEDGKSVHGFASKKMERNIVDFVNLLVEYDAKATFPITANMKLLILGSKEYPMGTNKGEDPLPSGGIEIYTGNLVEFFMEKG